MIQGDRGAPQARPAGAGRNDLGRGLRAAVRARSRRKGITHTVLNAKPEHAEREGETIAEAGAPGAVTIATNMAGRGVDIKLGGNPEHLTTTRAGQARPAARDARLRRALRQACCPRSRAPDRGRARAGAGGRRPVHPRHRAPRVAPDRQPAPRPLGPPGRSGRVALLPLGPGRPGAAVRRRADLQDPRPARGRSTTRATRSRSRRGCSPSRSRRRRRRSRSSTS